MTLTIKTASGSTYVRTPTHITRVGGGYFKMDGAQELAESNEDPIPGHAMVVRLKSGRTFVTSPVTELAAS